MNNPIIRHYREAAGIAPKSGLASLRADRGSQRVVNIGVVFPQTDIGPDAGAVRAYAQAADELAFTHLRAYDHVVGADPAVHKGWDGPTTSARPSTSGRPRWSRSRPPRWTSLPAASSGLA